RGLPALGRLAQPPHGQPVQHERYDRPVPPLAVRPHLQLDRAAAEHTAWSDRSARAWPPGAGEERGEPALRPERREGHGGLQAMTRVFTTSIASGGEG